MPLVFLVATLVAPAVLAFVLRGTRAWWATGAALAGFGVFLLLTLDHGDRHGEDGIGAWYAIGNILQQAYGVVMLAYAGLLVALVVRARRKSRRWREPPVPPARVV